MECKTTVDNLMSFNPSKLKNPNILVLHSSNVETSNTYSLWQMVKKNLNSSNIKEIHIDNGSVVDCKGCVYKECKHYSESQNCFYGGVMVEEVYPAIVDCDVLVMLCPNYNDSVSANMAAVINRLTALFRKVKFYDKSIFAIVVSGHSGSELIAEQLIGSLNINKTFMLPSNFALMETANDFGEVNNVKNIHAKAFNFAENMKSNFAE
jgi:multimeric flavodoxin WrbA